MTMTDPAAKPAFEENRLAARRRLLCLPQAPLAERCGISRQFLSLLEAGRAQPNVQLALKLAAELGASVEELFGGGSVAGRAGAALALADPALPDGTRLTLARLGGRWVGHAADTALSLAGGFAGADAVLSTRQGERHAVPLRATAEIEHNLLVAGCDPSLALLAGADDGAIPGRCVWLNCGSARALDLLAGGWVHAAGLHYGGIDPAANLRRVGERDPAGHWTVVRFTRWENGWILRPARRMDFPARAEALAGGKLRLANRERGSGSRQWLDAWLKRQHVPVSRVAGYDRELPNHWEAARALADGRADVAVGPRAIAAAFGLGFVAAEEVAFDLVVPRALADLPRMQWLLHRVRSAAFQRDVAALPGYAAGEAGRVLARASA